MSLATAYLVVLGLLFVVFVLWLALRPRPRFDQSTTSEFFEVWVPVILPILVVAGLVFYVLWF